MELRAELGIPINATSLAGLFDEYVRLRRKERKQGRTPIDVLRQIERVSRFWHVFAGNRLITAINEAEPRDYAGRAAHEGRLLCDMVGELLPSLPSAPALPPIFDVSQCGHGDQGVY